MRVLKIGRSSSNDIILNDPTVSSQHATITISDTGEVRVKDLSSKNGTYINEQRIYQETLITAKDAVKAGNSIIDWQKKLSAPKPVRQFPVIISDTSAIKQKKTIGRNVSNDIVVAHSEVSGTHAQLIQKENGDIVIADSGSTNGTYVNGQKVSIHVLKSGDSVLLAKKYPLDWSSAFPKAISDEGPKANKTKTLLIAAAALVVLAASGFLYFQKSYDAKTATQALLPEQIFSQYKKSVVLIFGAYYYEASANGKILGNYSVDYLGDVVEIDDEEDAMSYSGTGFIVSNDGKIITNRHIAYPWDYEEGEMTAVKTFAQKRTRSEVKVEGILLSIGCFVNDTHISSQRDLIPCTVLKTSNNLDIDVALIQINSKALPSGVERIVDLNEAVINDDEFVVGSSVYTIGFPAGLGIGMTEQGIEANNQDGKITQLRGDIEFGHNIATTGGASGSPVFNQYGQLIGIHHAGFVVTQGYNLAIKAKYAVELVK